MYEPQTYLASVLCHNDRTSKPLTFPSCKYSEFNDQLIPLICNSFNVTTYFNPYHCTFIQDLSLVDTTLL